MLSWFVVSKSESESENENENNKNPDICVKSIIPEDLLDEIKNFKFFKLEKNMKPDLLESIKKGISLKHVNIKEKECSFLIKLQRTLEATIINKRIKTYGSNNNFSYSDKEYSDAFKKFMAVESYHKYKTFINISFVIFVSSSIGILINKNPFIAGVYLTNFVLAGSFLISNI